MRTFELESRVGDGRLIVWIHGCQQFHLDALNGIATAVDSPGFCPRPYNYMLCLRIYFNGVGSGVGEYIAVFVHLMKGPYDDDLKWPFPGKIKLSILDQSKGPGPCHHITCPTANPNMLACQRPTAPVNAEGFGHEKFAPIARICQPPYMKDDTISVSIVIKWCHEDE